MKTTKVSKIEIHHYNDEKWNLQADIVNVLIRYIFGKGVHVTNEKKEAGSLPKGIAIGVKMFDQDGEIMKGGEHEKVSLSEKMKVELGDTIFNGVNDICKALFSSVKVIRLTEEVDKFFSDEK